MTEIRGQKTDNRSQKYEFRMENSACDKLSRIEAGINRLWIFDNFWPLPMSIQPSALSNYPCGASLEPLNPEP
jgi:hypothetical protein